MFNAFFMECYLNEITHVGKAKYRNLAFGKGGLILTKESGQYLCQGNGEIKIPVEFKENENYAFQNRDEEYDKFSLEIINHRLKTVKKSDKANIVNTLIINSTISSDKAKKSYKYILIALVLKILDITESFDVEQVDLNFIINSSK